MQISNVAPEQVNPRLLQRCTSNALAVYGQMRSNSFADHTFYQLKMIRSLENKESSLIHEIILP